MRWLGVVLGCIWCAAGCAAPAPQTTNSQPSPVAPPPQATQVVVVQAGAPRAGLVPTPAPRPAAVASVVPAALPLSVLVGRSAADVRVTVGLILREQVYLDAMAADAGASARLDELGGASAALDQNSLVFAEIVGAVKGQTTAQALLNDWRGLSNDVALYAEGHQATASADMERRRPALAAQLALGDFSPSLVDDLLRSRTQALLSLADSEASHDDRLIAQRVQSTAAASDHLALPLARAIVAAKPDLGLPTTTEGLDVDLRLNLTAALQAQSYLTGAALDAAADGRSADLQALVGAADANAANLGDQVGSVYGGSLGTQLTERFKAETIALVRVASGGDRRQAAADVERLRGELDSLLSGANQLLPPDLLAQQLRASDQAMLTAADAFQSRDWSTAYARVRESARQSQKPAEAIALSIVDRYPGRYLDLPSMSAGRGGGRRHR